VAGDLTAILGFNSCREETAPWERSSAGEGEGSGNKWMIGEVSREGLRFLFAGVSSVYGGLRQKRLAVVGGFSEAASCTECREPEKSVGGGSVWMQLGRVQRVSREKDAWHGRFSAWRCRARVSWCRGLDAVLLCVKRGAGRGVGAWECDARAARSGRLNRVGSAWSG
jgi:hypothetical protein